MFRRRVLRDQRVAGQTTTCPECGNEMTSLPELYYDQDGMPGWWIGFYCPIDQQTFPVWAQQDPLVEEITRAVDITSLPLWPEGHQVPKRSTRG